MCDDIHNAFYQAFYAPRNQSHQQTEYSRYDESFRYNTRDEITYLAPPLLGSPLSGFSSEYDERPYYPFY